MSQHSLHSSMTSGTTFSSCLDEAVSFNFGTPFEDARIPVDPQKWVTIADFILFLIFCVLKLNVYLIRTGFQFFSFRCTSYLLTEMFTRSVVLLIKQVCFIFIILSAWAKFIHIDLFNAVLEHLKYQLSVLFFYYDAARSSRQLWRRCLLSSLSPRVAACFSDLHW
jgi:hypothetical protein